MFGLCRRSRSRRCSTCRRSSPRSPPDLRIATAGWSVSGHAPLITAAGEDLIRQQNCVCDSARRCGNAFWQASSTGDAEEKGATPKRTADLAAGVVVVYAGTACARAAGIIAVVGGARDTCQSQHERTRSRSDLGAIDVISGPGQRIQSRDTRAVWTQDV